MRQQSEYLIDPRTPDDVRRQIKALAASYTPEWIFDEKNPDAGSVIALIFTNQMSENIAKINQVMGKYHTEFINMLNISLLPAYPASGVVAFRMISDTVPGVMVPKGTKLLSSGEEAESLNIIFETVSNVYISSSCLSDIYMISGQYGKIITILGDAARPELIPGENGEEQETKEEPPEEGLLLPEEEAPPFPEISLFDYRSEGIERNALILYDKCAFDTAEGSALYLKLQGNPDENFLEQFADPERYRFSYLAQDGLTPFDSIDVENGCVTLQKKGEAKKLQVVGEEYSVICIEALEPVTETLTLQHIEVSSACQGTFPTFVFSGAEDLECSNFLPFGETVSIFGECYIGHDEIFRQQGATITMRFKLSHKEKLVSMTAIQEIENLKIIKRKERIVQFNNANTSPQRVAFEYFNGTGWRKLLCTKDWSTVFEGTAEGDISITFVCPDDWQPTVTGGYDQRCVRMRVTQADNCYLQPCVHRMPVIENFTLSYSYFGAWRTPHRVRRVCGTRFEDITVPMLSRKPFVAFSPLPYVGNSLYLGFDQKMADGPVCIFFDIQSDLHFTSAATHFEYSSLDKFERLKVIDHTQNMSGTGTVMFVPPIDFSRMEIEGKNRYWIRIVDEHGAYNDPKRQHAVIRSILLNAVEIRNAVTMKEEKFYVEAAVPNMSFSLSAINILSLELFVNEKDRLSVPVMRKMAREQPENVRVSYDFLGDISEFFVRWAEVDSFDSSSPTDRHYLLDRMTSTIYFGDGVSVMIPAASRENASFTVSAVCCDGEYGNLPQGVVNTSYERMLYINTIYNPIATYGGSNIESIEAAYERGANIVNSKNRLVSELDFVREVKSFSSTIDKVKCVIGASLDHREASRMVNVVVMMTDYTDGPFSFNSIRDRLKKRLLSKCEATLQESELLITAPVFVRISVNAWIQTPDLDRSFELQNLIQENITMFLEPLSNGSKTGWEIGQLATETQIRQMIHSIRCNAVVKYCVITAEYSDQAGTHECDLSALPYHPFMVGINGQHAVHLIQSC